MLVSGSSESRSQGRKPRRSAATPTYTPRWCGAPGFCSFGRSNGLAPTTRAADVARWPIRTATGSPSASATSRSSGRPDRADPRAHESAAARGISRSLLVALDDVGTSDLRLVRVATGRASSLTLMQQVVYLVQLHADRLEP